MIYTLLALLKSIVILRYWINHNWCAIHPRPERRGLLAKRDNDAQKINVSFYEPYDYGNLYDVYINGSVRGTLGVGNLKYNRMFTQTFYNYTPIMSFELYAYCISVNGKPLRFVLIICLD
jgi:hypothetical protein